MLGLPGDAMNGVLFTTTRLPSASVLSLPEWGVSFTVRLRALECVVLIGELLHCDDSFSTVDSCLLGV